MKDDRVFSKKNEGERKEFLRQEGSDQHAVWIPLPHFFLQTSPPSLPGNSTGRPCFVISVWLFGTSSTLVPGRAHVQCSGVLYYCEPLMWHSSGVASSISGKRSYEHTRLPYVLCCGCVSEAFDSPDTIFRECGQVSDTFQKCCARTQSKEAIPRRPFHHRVGLDLSCDLMWLQAGGKYFLQKKRKRKLPKEILMALTCRGQIGQ